MARTTVGILRGGDSREYPLSLRSGAALLSSLPEEKYDVRDIFIDKNGAWHSRGAPSDPMRAVSLVDVVVNTMHGGIGENGTVQRMLDIANVPYIGSSAESSAASLNKIVARDMFTQAGLRVPSGVHATLDMEMPTGDMARAVFERFAPPYIVKPVSEGSSHGVRVARTVVELPDVIGDVLDEYGSAVIEEFIRGKEVVIGVISGFRDEELYALPPAEVLRPTGAHFVSHDHILNNLLSYSVPSTFTLDEKDIMLHAAKIAHRALGLGDFSRIDMIMTPRGPVILEADSSPHWYDGAVFPQMLESVGSSRKDLMESMIGNVLR